MMYQLYSIRDNLTDFMAPAIDITDESAIRNFSIAIENNMTMHRHTKDFDLYCLGTFNSETGAIVYKSPRLVVTGVSLEVHRVNETEV